MATETSNHRDVVSDRTAKLLVPLIGTGAAVFAALLSGFLVWFTNDKTRQIQEKLAVIQQDQFAAEQSAKSGQFNRDSERQYVALVYNDLLAKDAARQRAALSLLQVLAPDTSLKLLAWANGSKIILPENQAESRKIEGRLETLQANGRFRLFVHIGQARGRPVPEPEAIRKALAGDGYAVTGLDNESDNYGPGVDFFNESDKEAAKDIARIVTELRPGNPGAIPIRKQSIPNRNGTIGIWF